MIQFYNNGAWHKNTERYVYYSGAWHKTKERYAYNSGAWHKTFSGGGGQLGNLPVGSLLKINESGVPQQYIIVHQGNPDTSIYDSSCEGTWALRKKVLNTKMMYSTSNVSGYNTCGIKDYLENSFEITPLALVKSVKIPYMKYWEGGRTFVLYDMAYGMSVRAFLLGRTEIGGTYADHNDGAKLDYFAFGDNDSEANALRKAYDDTGTNVEWWTRSPAEDGASMTQGVYFTGYMTDFAADVSLGVRPAMILYPDAAISSAPDSDGCYTLIL